MGQTETTPKGEAKKGTDRMEQPTAEKGSPNATESNRHAQEMKRGEKADKEKFGESKTDKGRMDEDRAAQGERGQGERSKPGAPTTAEQGRQGGPQGNAGAVTLNDEQRTRIRDTVINARGAPRVGSVDFGVNVGMVIPRGRVQIVPVPEMLVQIEPGWRDLRYFIYEDELVIVDPRDMTIVAVVPI